MITLNMNSIRVKEVDGQLDKQLPAITGIEYIRIPEEMAHFLKELETYHGILGFEYDPSKAERTIGVMLGRS